MKLIRDHKRDPIYAGLFTIISSPRSIELRIGKLGQGEGRYAVLSANEAKSVGAALIALGEKSLAEAEEDAKRSR